MLDKDKDLDKDLEKENRRLNKENKETNPDPITGEAGAHPVGTGLGAAGAGAAGAAIGGALGGPIGAVVGAAIGGVGGGLAGKGVAEMIDPTQEEAYWRDNYRSRDYVEAGLDYDVYDPAYRYGWEAYGRYPDRTYEDIEPELRKDWDTYRGNRTVLEWDRATYASRDAWDRAKNRVAEAREKEANR